MGILPDNFKVKDAGNYMKLKPGENKFRILGNAIAGMEWWVEADGKQKPRRKPLDQRISPEELDAESKPRQFIAFPVWNYADEAVQILQLTQKGVMKTLASYEADEDWGDLSGYDIKITRTGEGYDTTYMTSPSPKKPIEKHIAEAYKQTPINLNALFDGSDPFADNYAEEVAKALN